MPNIPEQGNPHGDNPKSLRAHEHTPNAEPAWLLEASRSNLPRERALPAEYRISLELGIKIAEASDGELEPLVDKPRRWTEKATQRETRRLFGNPFGRVDDISESRGLHFRRIHQIYPYFRDVLHSVYSESHEPKPPSLLGYVLSYPPVTSQIEDIPALKDAAKLIASHIPGFRGIVPEPGAVSHDIVTIATDVAKLGIVGIFLFPGSVGVNRSAEYKSRRIIEMYLPQVARRALESLPNDVDPRNLSHLQLRLIQGINTLINRKPGEVAKTQKATEALIKKILGERDPLASQQTNQGQVVLEGFPRKQIKITYEKPWYELTESETGRIIQLLREKKIAIQDVNRLMTGLDALAAIRKVVEINKTHSSTNNSRR